MVSPREQLAAAIAAANLAGKELDEVEGQLARAHMLFSQTKNEHDRLSASVEAALVDHYEAAIREPSSSPRKLPNKPPAEAEKVDVGTRLQALKRVLSRLENSAEENRSTAAAASAKASDAAWGVCAEEADKRLKSFLKLRDQYWEALDVFQGLAEVPSGRVDRGPGHLSPVARAALAPRPDFAPFADNNPITRARVAWHEFHTRLLADADAVFISE